MQNLDGSLNTALLSPDRLHPLDTGYQQTANAFFAPIVSSVMSTRHDTVMQMPTLTMSGTTDQWVAQIDLGEIDLVISNSDLANLTDQKVRPCHGQQGRMARQSNHLVGRHQ